MRMSAVLYEGKAPPARERRKQIEITGMASVVDHHGCRRAAADGPLESLRRHDSGLRVSVGENGDRPDTHDRGRARDKGYGRHDHFIQRAHSDRAQGKLQRDGSIGYGHSIAWTLILAERLLELLDLGTSEPSPLLAFENFRKQRPFLRAHQGPLWNAQAFGGSGAAVDGEMRHLSPSYHPIWSLGPDLTEMRPTVGKSSRLGWPKIPHIRRLDSAAEA